MKKALGLLLLFTFSFSAWASPAEEPNDHNIPILDTAQTFFGSSVNGLANDVDSFFATERADDELGRSRFRYRRDYHVEDRQLMTVKSQIRFNLRFPGLENRFRKMVEFKKKKAHVETPEEKAERMKNLAEANKLDTKWLVRGDMGVSASIHPDVVVRGRLRKSWETGTVIHRFAQEATWNSYLTGFRHQTTLQSDQTITRNILFRFGNLVDWHITSKDFTTTHGPGVFQRVTDDVSLYYNAGLGTTVQNGSWFLGGYSALTGWRRNLYRQMMYIDVSTGFNFPKQWHFRRSPFIHLQFELLFGS